MIEQKDLMEIGKFLKTHALAGELNAVTEQEVDLLDAGYPIILEREGLLVPFFVDSFRRKSEFAALVKLEGIESVEEANPLVNHIIYMLKRDVAEYFNVDEEELLEDEELIGYKVSDVKYGEIGEVVGIDDATQNLLLLVERQNGELVYIPYVNEIILSINDMEENGETISNKGIITVNLPEGLLDLN